MGGFLDYFGFFVFISFFCEMRIVYVVDWEVVMIVYSFFYREVGFFFVVFELGLVCGLFVLIVCSVNDIVLVLSSGVRGFVVFVFVVWEFFFFI